MIKRIWHAIFGHDLKWHYSFCPGSDNTPWSYMDETRLQLRYGFTEGLGICSCGKRKTFRVVGKYWDSPPKKDSEIDQLRKMAGLS